MRKPPQPKTALATPITDAFDPDLLPSGVYVVVSGTEAWQFARLAEAAGAVEVLGEHDDANGGMELVFRPRTRARGNETAEGAITLGPEYFQAPLREYTEWPVKWWREVVQNAADAGAARVHLGTVTNEDGTVTAFCEDNAGGMSKEVLFGKFLVMGGTTKTAGDTVGGFGKAKELILLPWLEWEVKSGEYAVRAPEGGAAWKSSTGNRFHGTRVSARQPAGNHTTIEAAMEFLQRSWFENIRFTLTKDGEIIPFERKQMYNVSRAEPLRSLPDMDIYFQEGERRSIAWVRVGGLFMFSRWTDTLPGQLVVELKGSSIKTLTSNRDGFARHDIARQLDGYLNEVAKDTTSALKKKKGLLKKKYVTGRKTVAYDPPQIPYSSGSVASVEGGKRILTEGGIVDVVGQLRERMAGGESGGSEGSEHFADISTLFSALAMAPDLLSALAFSSDRGMEKALKQIAFEPDFILINEVENFKIPARFLPETMTVGVARLAKVWLEVCRWVLMQLECGEPYAVGFLFDKTTGAAYLKEGEEHWLLLNPYALEKKWPSLARDFEHGEKPENTLDFLKVTDRKDFQHLYALAVHEATHFANGIGYHDEAFASAMTHNFAICADGMGQWRTILDATASKRTERKEKAPKIRKIKEEAWPAPPETLQQPFLQSFWHLLVAAIRAVAKDPEIGDNMPSWRGLLPALQKRRWAFLSDQFLDLRYSDGAPGSLARSLGYAYAPDALVDGRDMSVWNLKSSMEALLEYAERYDDARVEVVTAYQKIHKLIGKWDYQILLEASDRAAEVWGAPRP